MKKVTVAITH